MDIVKMHYILLWNKKNMAKGPFYSITEGVKLILSTVD